MNEKRLIGMIENILFAAGDSVPLEMLSQYTGVEQEELAALLDREMMRRGDAAGLVIQRLEDRYQLCTRQEYCDLLAQMFGKREEGELTRAMIETLAIIAYRQPVTRGEIEELRGVGASYILGVLLERGLIVEAGRKEALGRPILYQTSEEFLRRFGIASKEELPSLPAV